MPVGRKKDIAKLDVAMDDALFVDIVDDRGKFGEPLENVVLVKFLRTDIRERARAAVFVQDKIHHEIRRPRCFVEVQVEDVYEVLIMQTRQHLSFGQELVLKDIDMSALKRKRLQCVVNAELRMLDLVTAPIPPCPRRRMIR